MLPFSIPSFVDGASSNHSVHSSGDIRSAKWQTLYLHSFYQCALNVFSLSLSVSHWLSAFLAPLLHIYIHVCVCLIQILLQCRTDCLLSYSDFELNSFGLSFDLFLYFRIMMSITILKITFTKIFLAVFKMNLLKKWF